MLILIHANGFPLCRELRGEVQSKIETSFARFSGKIRKVHAYLADLNGPKQGVDKSIRLVISIEQQSPIIIEEKGNLWSALLESVTDRAVQNLGKQLKRSRNRLNRASAAGGIESVAMENISRIRADTEWNPLREGFRTI